MATTLIWTRRVEAAGVSVSTMDLSEAPGDAGRLPDDDARVAAKIEEIRTYADASSVPDRWPRPLRIISAGRHTYTKANQTESGGNR